MLAVAAALQQAAVQKARLEAESTARLAEMAARQDHERQLHALTQDQHKKRLTVVLVCLGVLLLGGLVGGGIVIKNTMDQAAAARAQANELRDKIDQAEAQSQKLKRDLENAKDPEQIEALQRQLADQQAKIQQLNQQAPAKKAGGGGGGGGGGAAKPAGGGGGGSGKPCNCTPGDPLCSCL